jgi:hypothetical protein
VIVRTWRGWVRTEDAAAYIAYIDETGMREYRETPGNLAAPCCVETSMTAGPKWSR